LGPCTSEKRRGSANKCPLLWRTLRIMPSLSKTKEFSHKRVTIFYGGGRGPELLQAFGWRGTVLDMEHCYVHTERTKHCFALCYFRTVHCIYVVSPSRGRIFIKLSLIFCWSQLRIPCKYVPLLNVYCNRSENIVTCGPFLGNEWANTLPRRV
jgi:hypothetical protein